jgi:hypothetical protein
MELPSFGSPLLHPAKAQSKHNNNVKMQSFLNIRIPPAFFFTHYTTKKEKFLTDFCFF